VIVAIEAILANVGDVNVGPAVVVEVSDGDACAPAVVGDAGLGGDIGEGAVVIVAEERGVGWSSFAGERIDRGTVDDLWVQWVRPAFSLMSSKTMGPDLTKPPAVTGRCCASSWME
jgi:hypothetical protein